MPFSEGLNFHTSSLDHLWYASFSVCRQIHEAKELISALPMELAGYKYSFVSLALQEVGHLGVDPGVSGLSTAVSPRGQAEQFGHSFIGVNTTVFNVSGADHALSNTTVQIIADVVINVGHSDPLQNFRQVAARGRRKTLTFFGFFPVTGQGNGLNSVIEFQRLCQLQQANVVRQVAEIKQHFSKIRHIVKVAVDKNGGITLEDLEANLGFNATSISKIPREKLCYNNNIYRKSASSFERRAKLCQDPSYKDETNPPSSSAISADEGVAEDIAAVSSSDHGVLIQNGAAAQVAAVVLEGDLMGELTGLGIFATDHTSVHQTGATEHGFTDSRKPLKSKVLKTKCNGRKITTCKVIELAARNMRNLVLPDVARLLHLPNSRFEKIVREVYAERFGTPREPLFRHSPPARKQHVPVPVKIAEPTNTDIIEPIINETKIPSNENSFNGYSSMLNQFLRRHSHCESASDRFCTKDRCRKLGS
ncbi:unnamed protein product, partial [Notodromas monacha]